jgi:hypothetical protein
MNRNPGLFQKLKFWNSLICYTEKYINFTYYSQGEKALYQREKEAGGTFLRQSLPSEC